MTLGFGHRKPRRRAGIAAAQQAFQELQELTGTRRLLLRLPAGPEGLNEVQERHTTHPVLTDTRRRFHWAP